jgi:hypothetical protein
MMPKPDVCHPLKHILQQPTLSRTELPEKESGATTEYAFPEETLCEGFKFPLQVKRGNRTFPRTQRSRCAAKDCILDPVLTAEALFMVDAAWKFLLPLNGALLLAPPLFAAIAEFAPRAHMPLVVSAPFAALPVLHPRKKVV